MVITMTNGKEFIVDIPEKEEHVHTYGELVDFGDNSVLDCDKRIYFSVCSGCSEIKWVYGKYADHDFATTYSNNGFYHWFACANCDTKGSYEEHTLDDGGYCSVCEQHLTPSEGIVYEIVDDHAEVIDYTGTAERIMIADTYEGKPVTKIAASAFASKKIVSVILSEGITTIGDRAFNCCYDLTTIIPSNNLQTIGFQAFSFCDRLSNMCIPESVKFIGNLAFQGCSALQKEKNGVTYVDNWAISCENAVTVT